MKPRTFIILNQAVYTGIQTGLLRLEKLDKPSMENYVTTIHDAVMESIDQWFDLSHEDLSSSDLMRLIAQLLSDKHKTETTTEPSK